MAQYKFTKQVTLNGTWKDGHVPTPSRTFNVGDSIDGTCSPASSYPLTHPSLIRFEMPNGEAYSTEATNTNGNCSSGNGKSSQMSGLVKLGIGIVIVLAIIGILKLFKVF